MRSPLAQQLMRRSLVAALVVAGSVNAAVASPAHAARVRQQTPTVITGIVIDARSRQPVSGASVFVVGTRLGTQTGADGRYRMGDVSPGSRVLSARRIGYASQWQTTSVSGGHVVVNFALEQAAAVHPLPDLS